MESVNQIIQRHTSCAPVNIEQLIRDLGIELDSKAELHSDISGQLERLDDGKYKISVNKNHHYYRRRFSMAHELGHFLLHLHLVDEGVDDSKMYRSTDTGRFYNEKITNVHETEANKFASHILTPDKLVETAIQKNGNDAQTLSKIFKVSEQAMKIRLKQFIKA
jgi:Zn-dependent peptidase ImmA (M78 family)